jgi:hypothetical protein
MRSGAGRTSVPVFTAILAALLLMPACTVKEKKEGDSKKVDIQTPVGGMHVTNTVDARDVGLAVYPGARLKPGSEHNENSANVSISTSFFGLKVAVLQYLSDDSPDKVTAFYKQELARYGTVLECHTTWRGGNVVMHKGNDQQLTCDDHSGDTIELKTGTQNRQHVVAIKPNGKGSEFALVYVNTRGKDEAL